MNITDSGRRFAVSAALRTKSGGGGVEEAVLWVFAVCLMQQRLFYQVSLRPHLLKARRLTLLFTRTHTKNTGKRVSRGTASE